MGSNGQEKVRDVIVITVYQDIGIAVHMLS